MKFDIEQIGTYTAEQLQEFLAQFQETFQAKLALESPSKDDVTEAKAARDAIAAIKAEQQARSSATEEMAALAAEAETEDEVDDSAEDEEEEDEEPDEQVSEFTDETEEEEEEEPEEPKAKVASGTKKRTARQRLAGRRPKVEPEPEAPAPFSIIASADVRGFAAGSEIPDFTKLTEAVMARMESVPEYRYNKDASEQKLPVASFTIDYPEEHTTDRSSGDLEVIERVASESRLPKGSLVAAGGWCAPSETLYDLCAVEGTAGMISLPEFRVRRGGIRFTEGPDFATLYNGGFHQTEAQAEAGTLKTCIQVACPAFEELRLEVDGLCIRTPILTERGYPELIRNFNQRAMVAYGHKRSDDTIAAMVTKAGAAEVIPSLGSTATNALSGLELVAEKVRQSYRMPFGQALEVVVPNWVKAAIRADLAHRNGVELLRVSDSDIQAHFAVRGLNVQYVYGWQDLATGDLDYPATFDALVYPSGTFERGTSAVINLSAVYDHASLVENMYTGLFFEEASLLLTRCYTPRLVTLTNDITGRTGAADSVADLAPAAV